MIDSNQEEVPMFTWCKQWLGQSSRIKGPAGRLMRLETLEGREVPSATPIVLQGYHSLSIYGTEEGDNVKVQVNGGKSPSSKYDDRIWVFANGVKVLNLPAWTAVPGGYERTIDDIRF